MRLESPRAGLRRWLPATRVARSRWIRRLVIAACLAAVFVVPFARYAVDYRYTPFRPLPPSRAGFEALGRMALAIPAYYRNALWPSDELPQLRIDLKFRHLRKLIKKREEALRAGVLFSSDEDLVPAVLVADGREVRVKLRLKGDLVDHMRGDRWSFRVQVRDGGHVFGMRRFSLQAPYTRAFQLEPLFFDALRERGVLTPRYFFVDLVVNGTRIGVTALEEHFRNELVESQQRREGPILKYDEDEFWRAWASVAENPPEFSNWRNTAVSAFGLTRIQGSPERLRLYRAGAGMLRSLMENRLAPSKLFDPVLWGRYLAMCEVFGASHAVHWNNLRMYFNPLTFKLEPVAFDANTSFDQNPWQGLRCQGESFALVDHLLSDPVMQAAFYSALREVARDFSDPAKLETLRTRETQHLRVLRREFPWLRGIDWNAVRQRASKLAAFQARDAERHRFPPRERAPERPVDAGYPSVVRASFDRSADRAHLELRNRLPVPVVVDGLRFVPEESEAARPLTSVAPRPLPVRLAPVRWPELPQAVRIDLPTPPAAGADLGIAGEARAESGERRYGFAAAWEPASQNVNPVPSGSVAEALAQHAFLRPAGPAMLRVDRGTWDVDAWIALPPGVGLRIESGTRLHFSPGIGLVLRGPLVLRGEPNAPVILAGDGWAGLAVLESERPSQWDHVVIRGTAEVRRADWRLTGGVTFRRTEVHLKNVLFHGARGEDALNIIRSKFTMEDTSFVETASDALDADFATGTIRGGRFSGIGGDGIDAGGSTLEVSGVHLERVRDKAISVGEASQVTARDIRVVGAEMGVASKDGSRVRIENSRLSGISGVGLAAYVKKPVFGGASLEATALAIDGPGRRALAQDGSHLTVDGEPIETETVDVDALYGSQ